MEETNKNNIFPSDSAEEDDRSPALDENGGKSKKRKRPRKNIIITFIFSLLAAIVMWIVAVDHEGVDYEKTFTDVNIKMVGIEQTDMQIALDDNVRLDITVSGKRSQLSTLKSSSFTALVDVSSVTKEGKSDPLLVEIEHINGITVVSQSMTHLTVTAEKRVTDTFDIESLLGTAQLENGVNYSLICNTETVSVTGSESILKNIKRAVAYVNPEPKNITESFKSNCLITFESDYEIDVSKLKISPSYCEVEVVLTKEKSVPVEIKLEGGAELNYNASFHPSVTGVLISGEPKLIDEVENIRLNIPYEKITNQLGSGKTSFTVKGELEYPENISGVNGESEIDVSVDISSRVETVLGSEVDVKGCPLGYRVNVSDVEVKLTGLYEEIETIKASSIKVSLDLSQIVPSESEQRVRGQVSIENAHGTVFEEQCFVSVSFVNALA